LNHISHQKESSLLLHNQELQRYIIVPVVRLTSTIEGAMTACLMLERKIETVDWSKRVNLSIFGMIVVDSYLVYSQVQDSSEPEKEFYTYLAEELIDNTYDQVARRPRSSNIASPEMMGRDGMPRSGGLFGHLTPTKRKRRDRNNQLQQGRCCLCHKKTSSVCSSCRDESQKEVWCCHSKTGRDCFAQHYSSIHNS
jgi:hypothetical protein